MFSWEYYALSDFIHAQKAWIDIQTRLTSFSKPTRLNPADILLTADVIPQREVTMDERGNVYIANNRGVTAFNKNGHRILNVPVPPGGSNNITLVVKMEKHYLLQDRTRYID